MALPDALDLDGPTPALLDTGSIQIVLQPIINVATGAVVAAEALARFPDRARSHPDQVFGLAHAAGWGPELEAACLTAAFARRGDIPEGVVLTVNVSPAALEHPAVRAALRGDLSGVAVEITESAARRLDALLDSIADLRRRGALIAIDDASTGYAGLLRLSTIRPDLVKIDRSLVTGARDSDVQSVVIEALVSLSRRIGARVLGEGVESLDDLAALAALNVDLAQGYALGRPAADLPDVAPDVVEMCRASRRELMASFGSSRVDGAPAMQRVTAALTASARLGDLHRALTSASTDLGVDVIGLSIVRDGVLSEITAAGAEVDRFHYTVSDFPATETALTEQTMIEAHVGDPESDPAERRLLELDGFASLLLTPIVAHGAPLGILEFRHRAHRRWTADDMAEAETVAHHLAGALLRMNELG